MSPTTIVTRPAVANTPPAINRLRVLRIIEGVLLLSERLSRGCVQESMAIFLQGHSITLYAESGATERSQVSAEGGRDRQ